MNRRTERKTFTVEGSITVSKGEVCLPTLSLVKVEDRLILVQHKKGKYPMSSNIKDSVISGRCSDWTWCEVEDNLYKVILSAIVAWGCIKTPKLSHINPHTFLYTWCLSQGVNLYEEKILY